MIVSPGTYYENINFNGKNIVLRSMDSDDPDVVGATILDGSDSDSVVRFENDEDSRCQLSGFTIKNGHVTEGGGIYCYFCNPDIRNCVIKANNVPESGYRGGGIYCKYGHQGKGPTITDCQLRGNWATSGGGLYAEEYNVTIQNCLVKNNTNGGIEVIGNSIKIIEFDILNNQGCQGGIDINCKRVG